MSLRGGERGGEVELALRVTVVVAKVGVMVVVDVVVVLLQLLQLTMLGLFHGGGRPTVN